MAFCSAVPCFQNELNSENFHQKSIHSFWLSLHCPIPTSANCIDVLPVNHSQVVNYISASDNQNAFSLNFFLIFLAKSNDIEQAEYNLYSFELLEYLLLDTNVLSITLQAP